MRQWWLSCGTLCLVLTGAGGCESLQRKFTRIPKHPTSPPTPIVAFRDYEGALTPVERYRKHFLLWSYWNDTLIETLRDPPHNDKRIAYLSGEALEEMAVLQTLLSETVATRLDPLLAWRRTIHQELVRGAVSPSQVDRIVRGFESQKRVLHREFFWKDVVDSLQGPVAPSADVEGTP